MQRFSGGIREALLLVPGENFDKYESTIEHGKKSCPYCIKATVINLLMVPNETESYCDSRDNS